LVEDAAMLSGNSAVVSFSFGPLSRRLVILAALGVGALAIGASVAALMVRLSPVASSSATIATAHRPALPLLPAMAPDAPSLANAPDAPIIGPRVASASPTLDNPSQGASRLERTNPAALSPAIVIASQPKIAVSPLPKDAPLPPPRPLALVGPAISPVGPFDRWTAIYDLTAHKVYMPDGTQLEAHSGLGDRLDDPRHVDELDRGATPPHLYDLSLREELFHGVQALRLNPVGGESRIFGRAGLLAHTYMLGPRGDSNGCVSFKDYDAFLQAYHSGKVKRLAVVASLN
jgi:hypothetical protein